MDIQILNLFKSTIINIDKRNNPLEDLAKHKELNNTLKYATIISKPTIVYENPNSKISKKQFSMLISPQKTEAS